MDELIVLRAQRPSAGRLVLPGLGALFMGALTVAAIVNVAADPTGIAVGLLLVIGGTAAWLWWDLLKALGVVPLARVRAASDSIQVRPPMLAWLGRRHAMSPGRELKVEVLQQSSFMGGTYQYRFLQDQARVTLVSPAALREADLDSLSEALSASQTPLVVEVMDLGRGRGRGRA